MAPRPRVADLLGLLAPGQVLLVQRRGVISSLIRWVTDSAWSHVTMVGESRGAWIILESDLRGVVATKIETTLDDPTVTGLMLRDRSDLTQETRDGIVRAAWLETGVPYDLGVNVDILWHRLTSFHGWLNTRGLNCAEMVRDAYRRGWGVLLDPNEDPTPEALAKTTKLVTIWSWYNTPDATVQLLRGYNEPNALRP